MITINYSDELGMFVLKVDGEPMMKNKKESVLCKKMASWLVGQGR